jgi:hypothetical protein
MDRANKVSSLKNPINNLIQGENMRHSLALTFLTVAGTLFSLGSPAHADSWMDFDDTVGGLGISNDSQNPTILNQVTVVCPSNGFLVATSTSTAFLRNLGTTRISGSVVFSISRQRKRDEVYDTIVVQSLAPTSFSNTPSSIQRIESCTSGQTVTYFHTVHGFIAPGNQVATEGGSRLVVEFFNKRI